MVSAASRPRTLSTAPVDRAALLAAFTRTRARSRGLFDMLAPDRYYDRPIALRHPIVFYEGHLAAFNVIVVIKKGLGRPGVDEALERLFARGIDPDSEADADRAQEAWPSRDEVRQYASAADALVVEALASAPIDQPGHPILDRAEGVHAILEHEAMHQETLTYIWHRLPHEAKSPASLPSLDTGGEAPARVRARIPAGQAMLGTAASAREFSWDNERPAVRMDVPAFEIDQHNVTNADFLRFVEAGGYDQRDWWTDAAWARREAHGRAHPLFWERSGDGWTWRGQFESVPLPAPWPVWVTFDEAAAYARWQRARLPTEAEYHRAAFGTPDGVEREHPWGSAPPAPEHGNFDFRHWDPVPVGSYPAGASAWGVHDLVGNGWEWTSTPFAGFPGFTPLPSYPEYSADFFDGQHYVIKGASPVTARGLVRRSFRNWFRPDYPYVYAAFRTVSGEG